MIRVGLAGAGAMGRTHADAYSTIPDVQVTAVMDGDRDRATALAATLSARSYTDLATMLATEQLDVVDCCLPTPLHRATVEAAAERGCHVFCEKPLALSVADGQAMIAATRRAGVQLLAAQVVRFFPEYRRLSEALAAGYVGTPVHLTMLRQTLYPLGHDHWYRDQQRSGGIFLDLMIHDFDWALHHLGPAERVYARLVQHHESRQFAQGMATVRHRSGAISHITGTWGHPGGFTTMVELAGNGGLLRHHSGDTQPLRLVALPDLQGETAIPLPDSSVAENPYRTELAHFVDVVARHVPPLVAPEQALAALALAIAARTAAATSVQIVELPE
ncbi:MAG TPA: Gfo/Idh/MocA family oxidoreductase [Chloroflexota bacterium]|nr:Gfo/Idh/MocA family oxidoreductase [Chloroflexota bacterium]